MENFGKIANNKKTIETQFKMKVAFLTGKSKLRTIGGSGVAKHRLEISKFLQKKGRFFIRQRISTLKLLSTRREIAS